MSHDTAERWTVISALVVLGVYAYRRLIETAESGGLKNIIGIGNPVPLGQFATAWGFTYLVVAVMTEAAPGLGGSFAILIATADLLTNSQSVFGDVTAHTGAPSVKPGTGASAGSQAGAIAAGASSTQPGIGGTAGATAGAR